MFTNLKIYKLIANIINYFILINIFIISQYICNNCDIILYISDNKDIIDPLIYIAVSPELFLIGLIIYFLLFISFFNKYNQNVSFIKSMIMFLIIFY